MRRGRDTPSAWTRWRRLLPALLVVCAVPLDLLTAESVSMFPLLAAAPVAAAPLLSLAGTVAVGVAASLTGLLLVLARGQPPGTPYYVALSSLVLLTLLSAGINRLMTRDRRLLRSARDVAETVQRAVLPPPPGRIGPLSVAARYVAAEEEAAIGGDFYAVRETFRGVRLMLGDVRGKGLGAVETVTALLGSFHEAAATAPDLPGVVHSLEGALQRLNALRSGAGPAEVFATAVVAEIPSDSCDLYVANRGHPAPLLVGGGRARPLRPRVASLPLGLADLEPPSPGAADAPPDQDVPVDRFDLPPGATLVLFTDGVTEARDRQGVFYDPARRLSRPVPPGPDGLLDALVADLYRHTGRRLGDDAALLAVTRGAVTEAAPEAASEVTSKAPAGT